MYMYPVLMSCCVSQSPEYLTGDEEKVKEFRLRLQYFARGCQTYHNQLQLALKGLTALELKETQVCGQGGGGRGEMCVQTLHGWGHGCVDGVIGVTTNS